MAPENPRSVRERTAWENEQRQIASGLSAFQGTPETTAQRYTENPTEVPLTKAQQVERQQAAIRPSAPVAITTQRPAALVANADLIKAGGMHNPYDFVCQRRDSAEATITGERCYICNPPVEPTPEASAMFGPDAQFYADHPIEPPTQISEIAEPTKQREGDQPLPVARGGEYVQDRVIRKAKEMLDRGHMSREEFSRIEAMALASKAVGTQRYGTPLQIFNGRDTLQDAVDEARDMFMYLSTLQQAAQAEAEVLVPVLRDAMHVLWMQWADSGVQMTPEEYCTGLATVAVEVMHGSRGPLGLSPGAD